MERRGSDKHGPRTDELLEDQVEGLEKGRPTQPRADEFRQDEPAGPPERERDTGPKSSGSHPRPDDGG